MTISQYILIFNIIVLLFAIITHYFLKKTSTCEHMGNVKDNNNNNTERKMVEIVGTSDKRVSRTKEDLERIGKKNSVNVDLLRDTTFLDVRMIENEYDPDGKVIQTGFDKCLDMIKNDKNSHCVGYGLSGNSYYYPPSKQYENDNLNV